jgi:hypothetical protein
MVGTFPSLMPGQPQFKVMGASGIVAAVGAQEYVHPSFHGWSFLVVKNSDFRECMYDGVASARSGGFGYAQPPERAEATGIRNLNKKIPIPGGVEIKIQ